MAHEEMLLPMPAGTKMFKCVWWGSCGLLYQCSEAAMKCHPHTHSWIKIESTIKQIQCTNACHLFTICDWEASISLIKMRKPQRKNSFHVNLEIVAPSPARDLHLLIPLRSHQRKDLEVWQRMHLRQQMKMFQAQVDAWLVAWRSRSGGGARIEFTESLSVQ